MYVTVMEFNYGLMVPNMRATGKTMLPQEEVGFTMSTVIFMMVRNFQY